MKNAELEAYGKFLKFARQDIFKRINAQLTNSDQTGKTKHPIISQNSLQTTIQYGRQQKNLKDS
jgi:hypothetical protein